jgi:hypothetical protein
VTLELLHHEYLEDHPDGLRYTTFCDRYRAWLGRRSLVMRQVHIAGDKAFVDYSGKKARIGDPTTGEVIEVELFVGSSVTTADVAGSQTQRLAAIAVKTCASSVPIGAVPAFGMVRKPERPAMDQHRADCGGQRLP